MEARPKAAVVADASPASAEASARLLTARGCAPIHMARDAREVLTAVRSFQPEVVLLDAVLPGLDGPSLAEKLLALPLTVRPALLLTSAFPIPEPRAEALRQAGCAILGKPLTPATLDRALAETAIETRAVPQRVAARLALLLDRLSLPDRPGRGYLETAILFAWQDLRLTQRLTRALYPAVARRWQVDAKKVERDMRRAIEYAWKSGRIEDQYAIFGGTIDAQRGKPTCGEMIATLADILRLEG